MRINTSDHDGDGFSIEHHLWPRTSSYPRWDSYLTIDFQLQFTKSSFTIGIDGLRYDDNAAFGLWLGPVWIGFVLTRVRPSFNHRGVAKVLRKGLDGYDRDITDYLASSTDCRSMQQALALAKSMQGRRDRGMKLVFERDDD